MDSEGEIVVASFDGVGVPLIKSESANIVSRMGKGEKRQKKKEAIAGVNYTVDANVRSAEEVAKNLIYPENQEKDENDDKPRAKNVRRIASLERSKEEVIHDVMDCSIDRNPDNEKPLVVVADGALSLWTILMTYLSSTPFTGILDIIHVTEYLWKVANALYKEGSELGKKWVYDNLVLILDGRVNDVITMLERILETKKKLKKSQRTALTDCIRYFKNHLDWMKYDEYLKAGYPIGSGVVESTCGHTVKDRMEGTGRRWSVEGAEAILLLRSVYTSDDWDEYWKFHMQLERSFRYHDALIAIGCQDPFNELGIMEKQSEILSFAA